MLDESKMGRSVNTFLEVLWRVTATRVGREGGQTAGGAEARNYATAHAATYSNTKVALRLSRVA